jgi:alpha-ribazole phosphatase
MTSLSTIVDLIRHGEPVGGSKYRGQSDDPLSEKGWMQMRDAVGNHCPWQRIISSPLSRCSEFAQELASRHSLPWVEDKRFKEIGFGEWEGRNRAELMAEAPDALLDFYRDPIRNRPPGAEPLPAFRDRVVEAWNDALINNAGGHLLVVAHAGVIRMVVRHVLDMPLERIFRIQVPNAGLTRIQVDGQGADGTPRLLFHGGSL